MLTTGIRFLPPRIDAVVIGSSAGAVPALTAILPALPPTTPWPVVVVVHVPPRASNPLVDLFQHRCTLPVRAAQDKESVGAGIWFASPDYHLLVEKTRAFALSLDEPVHFSRPSIDVLFDSAADAFGVGLVGVVLTGANEDGADGARTIREKGGFVVVQDPKTADASLMPRAAIERAAPQWVADLPEIAAALRDAAIASAS